MVPAMVHCIVHDHGGHLQVSSAPGEGSTFRVLLPAAAEEAPACRESMPPLQPPQASPELCGCVLLVEDDPLVGECMNELISAWGLEVALVQDPRAAARRLEGDEHFDLLLTDQTMPGMTGLALARLARQHRPHLPVLLYTGNAADIAA